MLEGVSSTVGLIGAALILCLTVAAGTVAHELSHALALRVFGVPYRIEWSPGTERGLLGGWVRGRWASVTPRGPPTAPSPWQLRIAALMPLALAFPPALALAGPVGNPFAAGNLPLQAATIGWLACALPSPQDFSLVWYADRALEA